MRPLRFALLSLFAGASLLGAAGPLRVATFRADVTPPLGSALCQGFVKPAARIHDPLTARGVVLLSDQAPIVLCAVDWVGIADRSHDAWKEALARAAATTPDRVAVHCLHQHDAPGADLRADELVAQYGLPNSLDDTTFVREAMERTARAVHDSLSSAQTFTHAGFGAGRVHHVASNRRLMGPDGKVQAVRWSATPDPLVRAAPEGAIDPYVRLLSLWNGEKPLVSITYYATHPQSYYGQGEVSADFPGLARALREGILPEVAHIHFNGASGNVTAGKYNDGAHENRPHLAARLAEGMRLAWEDAKAHRIPVDRLGWSTVNVTLPARNTMDAAQLRAVVANPQAKLLDRLGAAPDLAWVERSRDPIEIAALRLGPNYILHMPGELFVEYQLAAQKMKPSAWVAMAAYGEYGPGYIGTAISYTQGGYETGTPSKVGPEVEAILMGAMRRLLK